MGQGPFVLSSETIFLHRLALSLGKTVAELEQTMTPRELLRWSYFDATVQPLPDRLADIHNALLCSTVCNIVRAPDSQPIQVTDFLVIKDRMAPVEAQQTHSAGNEVDRFRAMLGSD